MGPCRWLAQLSRPEPGVWRSPRRRKHGTLEMPGSATACSSWGPCSTTSWRRRSRAGPRCACGRTSSCPRSRQAARRLERRVRLHVKVDTGMHRLGVEPKDLQGLLETIAADALAGAGAVMTHFATADDDPEFLAAQVCALRRETTAPCARASPASCCTPQTRRPRSRSGDPLRCRSLRPGALRHVAVPARSRAAMAWCRP